MILNNRYYVTSKIGEGSFGEVFRGYNLDRNKEEVALKKHKDQIEESGLSAQILKEIQILESLSHPNILPLIDCFLFENNFYYVFDYCELSLRQYIGKIRSKETKNILFELLSALLYLKEREILHRDLKPENIMFGKEKEILLIDFGQARDTAMNSAPLSLFVGTLVYRPPEALLRAEYGYSSEIWSVGCIFYEMLTGSLKLSRSSF